MAKVRIKIFKVRKERSCRVRFDVTKLSDLETREQFKLVLQNRFECLQQWEEEPSVDDEWREIEKGYVEACEEVLGKAKSTKKEWISKGTWGIIERRQVAKNAVNMAKMRN